MRHISTFLLSLASVFTLLPLFSTPAIAVYSPLTVPNNKLCVHVFSPDEIELAAKLVNGATNASWGYVVVPIQATDRDRIKWTKFMNTAAQLQIIPIIRVATFGIGPNWAEPENADLIDFANFLNDLPWPTQNRYVIIFNEVNHQEEYGGSLNPEHYADILKNAITIFKQRSPDFFILPSALDNASINSATAMKSTTYLTRMFTQQPELASLIDGWNSHAYPNPGFVSPPTAVHDHSISSFVHDLKFLRQYTSRTLPVFITETGWDKSRLSASTIDAYYQTAFSSVWSHPQVATVCPFVLQAFDGPFTRFSLYDSPGKPGPVYQSLLQFGSTGQPLLALTHPKPLPVSVNQLLPQISTLFSDGGLSRFNRAIKLLLSIFDPPKTSSSITIGDKTYSLELAKTPTEKARGLSFRTGLAADQGMLFLFDAPGYYPFWMKDMSFDLDLVWIGADDRVVAVTTAKASDGLKPLYPPSPILKVLEVNANSGIQAGQSITIKF